MEGWERRAASHPSKGWFHREQLDCGYGCGEGWGQKEKLTRQSEQTWFSTGTRLVGIHACLIPALSFSPVRMLMLAVGL